MHQNWYNLSAPKLRVAFYRSEAGTEPIREWLLSLPKETRKAIGDDIKTVQFGWPLGMPLVRKMEPGLWEIRCDIPDGIARVFFTTNESTLVLLHAFIKKSNPTPSQELHVARRRRNEVHNG